MGNQGLAPGPSRRVGRRRAGRSSAVPALVAVLVVIVLVAVVVAFAHGPTSTPPARPQPNATVAALTTVVAAQQQQLAARQTVIVQQQSRIAQLESTVTAQKTPVYSSDGPHSYIATFQLGRYSYVLFTQWNESNGFVQNGSMRTADNYGARSPKSFTISGVDNNRSYGFTATNGSQTITFTGSANHDGTFTLNGLPWSVFEGFVGGTFSQTLHPGTMQQFTADVGNLAKAPA